MVILNCIQLLSYPSILLIEQFLYGIEINVLFFLFMKVAKLLNMGKINYEDKQTQC